MHRAFLSLGLLSSLALTAQRADTLSLTPHTESLYRVRTLYEGAGSLALMLGSTAGIESLRRKPEISADDLRRLSTTETGRLDRWGLEQDALRRRDGETASDRVFNTSVLLPLGLFLSKKFRKDWLDIGVLYLQAHAFNAATYAFSPLGPRFIDRYRPIAYYGELLPYDEINAGNNRNGFFSGHVSTTATGTFFFTKVLSDYHPQWTAGHRALAFSLAALPPAYVAVQRVRALKHFPTDTVVGLGVGAFFGVMVPHLHKVWQRNHRSRLSIGGGTGGAGFSLIF